MKMYFKKMLCIALALIMLAGIALPQLMTVADAAPLGGVDLGGVLGDIDLGGLIGGITWPWDDNEEPEPTYPEEEPTDVITTAPPVYDCGCDNDCPCGGSCDSVCSDCGTDCTCQGDTIKSMELVPVKPITVYKNIHTEQDNLEVIFTENDKLIVNYVDGTSDEYFYVHDYYSGEFTNKKGESIYLNASLPSSSPTGEITTTAFAYINGNKENCTITINVEECPVESISATYKYTLYDGYSCNIGRHYYGYDGLVDDYILCTVKYKDGTVKKCNISELRKLFNAKVNIDLECKALGVNEGTITMGDLAGKFTVKVEKVPENQTRPECVVLGYDRYVFAGEKVELQLLNLANKGYKPFYEIFNLPDGFTLSKDGKLSFTLLEDSAGKTYPLSFELRWKNSYIFYQFSFNIHSVDKKDAVKLPSKAEEITYRNEIKVKATAENPKWFRLRAADAIIAVDNIASNKKDNTVTLYNKDGIAVERYSSGGAGDGLWLNIAKYSVIRGEYYYIKVTGNATLYAELDSWMPSYKADKKDDSVSSIESKLIKTNEKKTFADDKNTLWNVYKLDCNFEIDMKNGFTYYRLGLMTRYASPVKIHCVTKKYSSNAEILAFFEYEYDVNGDWYKMNFSHIPQDTLKDELYKNETEYRFDNIYYFLEQTGKLTVDEERYIYLPQGYVFDENELHVIKHKKADHKDKAKDGFCDLCGIEIAKDNSKDEPVTEKPENTPSKPVERPAISKLGDIDGDDKITSADARLALRAAVGLEKISAEDLKYADANADGKITSADARLILRTAVGLEETVSFITNMPVTTKEITDFYKKGVDAVKNGNTGYSIKQYTTAEPVRLGNLIVNSKVKKLVKGFVSTEEDTIETVLEQGSEEAKNRIPAWTLTNLSNVSSATCTVNENNNLEITIILIDEDSPRKYGSVLSAAVPNIITYYEDIECTLNEDPTIREILSEYEDLHIIYKTPTIKAVMTPDGKFISLDYSTDVEVLVGKAKVCKMTIKDKSLNFSNFCKMYDFVY